MKKRLSVPQHADATDAPQSAATQVSGLESAERAARSAPSAHSDDNACIEEQALLQFLAGRLSPSHSERVANHLATCEACRELASSVNHEVGASTSPTSRDEAHWGVVLAPGTLLAGRHRIEGFIARGGMGEVYRARDTSLGDTVAIKLVSPHYSGNPEAIAQFKAEVQLARRIGHKNVCRIHDLGTHAIAGGSPITFLTMEFIEGESLGQRLLREGPLDVMLARALARGILEGLRAAHEAGVLHRDLKSDNVMLRVDGASRVTPILMDFGLASALNPNSSRVSSDQALVGSLAYMAPEQVQGEPLRVATDLYAFGVIVFEMLTGRLPFESDTPAIGALKRLQEPAPLLRDIDPTLPVDLEALVERCLQQDPKARFQSAQAAIDALDGRSVSVSLDPTQTAEVVTVPPTSTLRSAHRQLRTTTRRGVIAAGTLLTVGLALWQLSMRAKRDPVADHRTAPPTVTATPKAAGTASDAVSPDLGPRTDLMDEAAETLSPPDAPPRGMPSGLTESPRSAAEATAPQTAAEATASPRAAGAAAPPKAAGTTAPPRAAGTTAPSKERTAVRGNSAPGVGSAPSAPPTTSSRDADPSLTRSDSSASAQPTGPGAASPVTSAVAAPPARHCPPGLLCPP